MHISRLVKNTVNVLLLLGFSFSMTACKTKTSEFPSIPDPSEESVTESVVETEPSVEPKHTKLTVALPYDSSTISYLFKLYYAKNEGLMADNLDGLNVDLEFLDSVSVPISVENVYVPDDGVSYETAKNWGEDAPDIYLTKDLKGTVDGGLCLPLNDYLYSNELLDADNVYSSSIFSCMYDGSLYAIPHYCSIPMIYGNLDYVESGSDIDFKCSYDELFKHIDSIKEGIGEDDVLFYKGYQLLPYMTSYDNENDKANSFMLDLEYKNDSSKAQKDLEPLLSIIGDRYNDGSFKNFNEDGSDPVISRNCALWISSSSELSLWSSYYPNKLYYMQITSFSSSNTSIPYLTVYPLCVSSNSKEQQLAADFAAFVSLDRDALLLINRLEPKLGYLPLVYSSEVWDQKISDPQFGYIVSVYENMMPEAVYTPNVIDNKLCNTIESKLFACYNELQDTDESYIISLSDIYEN